MGHRERFLQDACGGLREMKSGEFLFARECDLSYIASRAGFTAEAFAKIVRNDKVKSRPSFNRSAG